MENGPIGELFANLYVPKMAVPLYALELGTKRWDDSIATHHKHWVPRATKYTLSDIEEGIDVDRVADAHALSDTFGPESMDIIIAAAVFEHLRLPWQCAVEARKTLKPGGYLYVLVPSVFPIHAYPSDYTRWTKEGLNAMFVWAGLTPIVSGYSCPVKLTPEPAVDRWCDTAPAYLYVEGLYRK